MSTGQAPVAVRPFRLEDQCAAKRLILQGMKEHWGYIDPNKNPDLDHIAMSYRNAIFVVAFREDELVGTGALVAEGERVGRVVRMTVARHCRRLGIGTKILRYLCEQAVASGYARLVLETTSSWTDAIGFYAAAGFKFTHRNEGETHFVRDLDRPGLGDQTVGLRNSQHP